MHTRLRLALILAVMANPLLADSLGGLAVSGGVWTNQVALPSGSSVYAGDRVKTAADGTAVVGSDVNRVEIRPSSDVTLRSGSVDLHAGVVATSGSHVLLGKTEIAPAHASPDALVVVSERNGETLVAAYRGDAEIREAGGRRTIVPAGSFALAAAAPQAPDATDSAGAEASREAAPAATNGNGWSLGSLASMKGVLIATGVAAAAATGVVVGTRDAAVSGQ